MSKSTKSSSDDEFQDALSEVAAAGMPSSSTKSNDETIEDLINKQLELNDNSNDNKDNNNKEDKEQKDEVGATEDSVPEGGDSAECLEEDIDEDELREAEKLMTTEELLKNKAKADDMKVKGNELFKNGEAQEALEIYTEALKLCPTTYVNERAVLYGNRAAAKIKLDSKKSAIDDCTQALKLWPDYLRVRIRRAKLYEHEDKLDLALEDYKHVYELDPGQPDAREACVRLPPIVNERNEKLKEEMMTQLKNIGNLILRPFGLSTSNFQMQQDPNTGSYSINFSQNPNSS